MILTCLAFALPAAVAAQTTDDLVQIDVLPGWTTADGTRMAALRLRLAPGWKTYWRAPGAAGIPPSFDWTGSQNVDGAVVHWPVPQVFHLNGMQSIGYESEVVLPVELTPQAGGAATRVAGVVDMGICHEVCVPVSLQFALDLPTAADRDPAIIAALVDRPLTADEAGVTQAFCDWTPSADGLTLQARVALAPLGPDEVMVIESANANLWVSDAATERRGEWLVAEARVMARDGAPDLVPQDLRLTILSPGRAVDIGGCARG